ncbi:glycopeptide [Auriscalpium vulgare]|uniref:Glycopeptide n=1 Tax=Auriscalpium vulgare TaxID=40419 RepID=A0ACB8RL59_9AGAM|nr:glycopeptide [Auriscalpium vulgare]
MAPTFITLFLSVLLAGSAVVNAESHTIRFDNQCGKGTPTLIIGGHVVSNGSDFTSSGPASSGIAYLQTGQCLFNGENCALTEFTLGNPTCAGCGSSVDISLIPPHALNVPTAFSFFNGCDGQGASCSTPDCSTAFFKPDDNQVQVACQTDNVDLLITFCGGGSSSTPASTSSHRKCQLRAKPLLQ